MEGKGRESDDNGEDTIREGKGRKGNRREGKIREGKGK